MNTETTQYVKLPYKINEKHALFKKFNKLNNWILNMAYWVSQCVFYVTLNFQCIIYAILSF